jgi:hypothetical protein
MTWIIRANMRVLLIIILEKYGLKMWAGYRVEKYGLL